MDAFTLLITWKPFGLLHCNRQLPASSIRIYIINERKVSGGLSLSVFMPQKTPGSICAGITL